MWFLRSLWRIYTVPSNTAVDLNIGLTAPKSQTSAAHLVQYLHAVISNSLFILQLSARIEFHFLRFHCTFSSLSSRHINITALYTAVVICQSSPQMKTAAGAAQGCKQAHEGVNQKLIAISHGCDVVYWSLLSGFVWWQGRELARRRGNENVKLLTHNFKPLSLLSTVTRICKDAHTHTDSNTLFFVGCSKAKRQHTFVAVYSTPLHAELNV